MYFVDKRKEKKIQIKSNKKGYTNTLTYLKWLVCVLLIALTALCA